MAEDPPASVLHFACHSCGTRLSVELSLAGLKAPCPKCGELLSAPEVEKPTSQIFEAAVSRGLRQGSVTRSVSELPRASGSATESERRQVYPTSGRMPSEDAGDNFQSLLKILGATGLVVLIVLTVTWYLKNF